MRCTAPMNAPSPPPTMPRRMRALAAPVFVLVLLPSMAMRLLSEAEHALQLRRIGGRAGKVVERLVGDADEVVADERRTLGRALLGVLEAALPFEHGPALVAVLRHLGEDGLEV